MALTTMMEALRRSTEQTQAELAESSGVSQTVISQIESGTREATDTILLKLAKSLNVDVAFLQIACPQPTVRHTFLSSVPARAVRKLEADLALAHAQVALITAPPELDVPRWEFNPREHFGVDRAHAVRRVWDVPTGPIDDLVGLLEAHGIICIIRDLTSLRVLAVLSTATEAPTIMFIDPSTGSSRLRWAMAHELGHLATQEQRADKTYESSADDFAAELLAPRRDLRESLRDDTAALAAHWGMPHSHLLRHAKQGGLISGVTMRRERAGRQPSDNSKIAGPSWIANAVRRRTRTPGETLAQVAAGAFMSVETIRTDYLAASRSM